MIHFLFVLLSACAWTRTELYCGTNRVGSEPVSAAEWQAFLREEVEPRFPNGFTVVESQGEWHGVDGQTVHEPTHIVVLLRQGHDAEVLAIAEAYRRRFHQETVLRVDQAARVVFVVGEDTPSAR